jgi:hypothetical protein
MNTRVNDGNTDQGTSVIAETDAVWIRRHGDGVVWLVKE